MANFFENLRAAESADQSNPEQSASNNIRNKTPLWPVRSLLLKQGKLRSPEDFVQEFQVDAAVDVAERKLEDQERNKRIKETAPLREAIKNASDGKVTVDNSIYEEEELRRILGAVQKMKNYNNGALFPGYTVISDSNNLEGNTTGEFLHGDRFNVYGFAPFPNGFYGTKNNPYRIHIRDANETGWNDLFNSKDIESGWHPKTGEEDQDSTHAHELSHSAHKEALKKSHPPTLWMSSEEDKAYKNLISKFSTFRELVQKLTDEYHLENTKNAAASVSGYAKKKHDEDAADEDFPFAEMFAEAYTDVLYNGDSARPYSKALVDAYSEYLNEYNAIFDSGINRTRRRFNNNSFIDNLRKSTPRFYSGRYIIE